MKIIITENQFEKLKEPKVLHIPSLEIFDNDWNKLQSYLNRKGNPLYSIGGNLYLGHSQIQSLGNLTSVGGYLDLLNSSIQSLGNLTSVGGYLDLRHTPIKSLGNLKSVGGNLYLKNTPMSRKYSEQKIRQIDNIEGNIYFFL